MKGGGGGLLRMGRTVVAALYMMGGDLTGNDRVGQCAACCEGGLT